MAQRIDPRFQPIVPARVPFAAKAAGAEDEETVDLGRIAQINAFQRVLPRLDDVLQDVEVNISLGFETWANGIEVLIGTEASAPDSLRLRLAHAALGLLEPGQATWVTVRSGEATLPEAQQRALTFAVLAARDRDEPMK